MNYSLDRRPLRGLALLLPLLAAACTDSSPVAPTLEPTPEVLAALQCTVQVESGSMTCSSVDPTSGSGASLARIVGGQNQFVRLANANNSYDAGTQIFQTDVTVQNLTRQALGTLDGTTPSPMGIMVFFTTDPVTITPGTVSVNNPTGVTFVTAPNQSYFTYNQVLQPGEISAPMTWQFNVPTVSTAFTFTVLIQADQQSSSLPYADKVWDGSASTDWFNPANWVGDVVPDSASMVRIPMPSQLAPGASMPTLTADAQLTFLDVGAGSTLTLGGFTLSAWGNVDALGTISGGTLWMRGTGVVLGGNLPSVQISGGAMLQRATRTSGAMSISDGSLVVDGAKPLSISIP